MWMNCPKCSGTGLITVYPIITTSDFTTECPVCKGKMIISKLTGLPPDYEANKKLRENENVIDKSKINFKNPLTPDEMFLPDLE